MTQLVRFPAAVLFALLILAPSLPATAAIIFYSGTFQDPTAAEADGDTFTITNDATSESDIFRVVFDLNTVAVAPVTFDPSAGTGSPFASTLGSDITTGLVNAALSDGNRVLTLDFTDFNSGETFTFTIDVDDNIERVNSNRMEGATVTATFGAAGGTDLPTTMVDPPGGGRNLEWTADTIVLPIPESGTGVLLGMGLVGLVTFRRRTRRA